MTGLQLPLLPGQPLLLLLLAALLLPVPLSFLPSQLSTPRIVAAPKHATGPGKLKCCLLLQPPPPAEPDRLLLLLLLWLLPFRLLLLPLLAKARLRLLLLLLLMPAAPCLPLRLLLLLPLLKIFCSGKPLTRIIDASLLVPLLLLHPPLLPLTCLLFEKCSSCA